MSGKITLSLYAFLQLLSEGKETVSDIFRADWIFFLVVLPVFLYILVLTYEKFPGLRLLRILFSTSYAGGSAPSSGQGSQASHFLHILTSLISISTLLMFAEFYFELSFFRLEGFGLWLLNLGIIGFSLLLRYMICIIIGKFTGAKTAFGEYIYYILLGYKLLAGPLLIINFFIPYLIIFPDNVLIISSFIIIGSFLLIRIARLIFIFMRRSLSLFYLILYLCALEIAPVLIFIKYLSGQIY